MSTKAKAKAKVGLSAADLDAQFNPDSIARRKITAALAQLEDRALPPEQFRKLCSLSNSQLGQYIDEFADHHIRVRVNGRIVILWAGSKKFAREQREKLGV